jgi:uncharacterized membrane protein
LKLSLYRSIIEIIENLDFKKEGFTMFIKNENKLKWLIMGSSLAIFAILLLLARSGENATLLVTHYDENETPLTTHFVPGIVVDYELIEPTDHTPFYGQLLYVKLLSGKLEGVVPGIEYFHVNPLFPYYEIGDSLVVILNEMTDSMMVYNPNRSHILIGFVVLFLTLLCIIGGKRGVLSLLGLIFSLLSIVWILVPLTLQGHSSILTSLIVAILITFVSITLLAGVNPKSLSAIAGCIFGVGSAALLAFIVGNLSFITGYHTPQAGQLMALENIDLSGIFVSGVIISAMGAIMDTSMTIASSMDEVKRAHPAISTADLFKAGLNVGRDAMGTMSNTLILAFVGSSLGLILLMFALDISFLQFINSDDIGIEIIQGIAGSIGIILTVPFTTLIASKLFSFNSINSQNKIR